MSWDQIAVKWAEMVGRVQPNGSERPAPPAPKLEPVAPKAEPAKGVSA